MKQKLFLLVNSVARSLIGYSRQLRDIRLLGLNLFVVIALLVTWSSIGVIQRNYELQKKLSELQQENEIRALENDTLRLKNEYYTTDQYLELVARKQFSKAAPGETLILVPDEVALQHSVPTPEAPKDSSGSAKAEKPKYQQNFEAWIEFFFRQNADV